jgi:hypothetical protein
LFGSLPHEGEQLVAQAPPLQASPPKHSESGSVPAVMFAQTPFELTVSVPSHDWHSPRQSLLQQ